MILSVFTFFFFGLLVKIESRQERILGGRQARWGEVPSIVAVYMKSNKQQICGGTLIQPKYVLSAAHCYNLTIPTDYKVMGGDINKEVGQASSRSEAEVSKIIPHPNYNQTILAYDFAILKLEKHVIESYAFRPIRLAKRRPDTNTNCQVAGWGVLNETDYIGSQMLMLIRVVIHSSEDCKEMPFHVVTEIMICAGEKEGGIDACRGDSGGPLICYGRLAGVISFGQGCGRKNLLGVYADVSAVTDWIDENSNENMSHISINQISSVILTVFFNRKLGRKIKNNQKSSRSETLKGDIVDTSMIVLPLIYFTQFRFDEFS